jgi:hypothetical protein
MISNSKSIFAFFLAISHLGPCVEKDLGRPVVGLETEYQDPVVFPAKI